MSVIETMKQLGYSDEKVVGILKGYAAGRERAKGQRETRKTEMVEYAAWKAEKDKLKSAQKV